MPKLPEKLRSLFGLPESRERAKRRAKRKEAAVKEDVRGLCEDRDGYCRFEPFDPFGCDGPSEWAHFGPGRRSKTRGMAPEARHTQEWSLMLCRAHHGREERHEIKIEPVDVVAGARGLLKFRVSEHGRTIEYVETELPHE